MSAQSSSPLVRIMNSIYTVSGTEVARATATETTTTINTGLQSGTIVIVKFGNKSVKIKI